MMAKSDKCWKDYFKQLVLYGLGSIALYCAFFLNNQLLIDLFCKSRIGSAIFSLFLIILAAGLYGNTVLIIIRLTLERTLEYNGKRKG